MSLTLSDAVTEVRYLLNEASPAFWTDDEIESWIKQGVEIIASKTLMAEADDEITLVADQLSYTSSDESWIGDLIEPYAAFYNNQSNVYKGLIKIHPRQIGNIATFTGGDPKYYCLHNRKIYIFPLTTATIVSAGGTVEVLYSCETDDITVLTDEYQHLAVTYGAGKAKQKDHKFAEAQSLLTQFYNETNFERADKHTRETDSVESFRIPRQGGGQGAKG